MITVTVLWIVFGAILMLNTLKHTGAITAIRGGFTNISPDRRIQAIIIAWCFGAFIEGPRALALRPPSPRRCWWPSVFPALAAVAARHDDPVHPGVVRRGGHPILVGINKGWITRPSARP